MVSAVLWAYKWGKWVELKARWRECVKCHVEKKTEKFLFDEIYTGDDLLMEWPCQDTTSGMKSMMTNNWVSMVCFTHQAPVIVSSLWQLSSTACASLFIFFTDTDKYSFVCPSFANSWVLKIVTTPWTITTCTKKCSAHEWSTSISNTYVIT